MKEKYLIGYLSREYARQLCVYYIALVALNLIFTLRAGNHIGFFELLFFSRDPFFSTGLYLCTIISWNYAKEEETRGNNDRRSVIYFKSVGFLYFTMVVINLVSTLYAGAAIDLWVLVINNDYKAYTVSILYALFEVYETWRRLEHEGALPDQLR